MTASKLTVDWPACRARGICHELAPEVIGLDPWGYPLVAESPIADHLDAVRSAVAGCPRQALRLTQER